MDDLKSSYVHKDFQLRATELVKQDSGSLSGPHLVHFNHQTTQHKQCRQWRQN